MMFKLKPQPTRLGRFIRWAQYFFLFAGMFALSYYAFVLGDRWGFQAYQNRQFERSLKEAQPFAQAYPQSDLSPFSSLAEADRARRESPDAKTVAGLPLGRLEIGSIGLAAVIMDGIDGKTLGVAVGHIPGTPLPGQPGNVGLAAHRDTFFRGLRKIHKDDEITLVTLHGSYRYRVDSTRVVKADNIGVLAATTNDYLTLVTCYPFYFVGTAPQRFIVRSHRISE
jgi:sortase A